MIFRLNYFKLCKIIYSKSTYLQSISTKSYSIQKIKNGPSLRDFLANNDNVKDLDIQNDEIITNKLLQNAHNLVYNQEDSLVQFQQSRKVFFEIHGCQMNTNDTEIAFAFLKNTGYYEKCDNEKDADVILIMTCSIRDNAEQKIWNRLREFVHIKKKRPDLQIGILGCMAERLKEKIVHKEKMVDIVCGPDSYRSLPNLLNESYQTGNTAMNVQLSLEETYAEVSPIRMNKNNKTAFVSIQRGCNNMCSFCIVPFVRGRERSRPISSIIEEVKQLSDNGIREATLLGQNVNSYQDLSEQNSFLTTDEPNQLSKGFKSNFKRKLGGRRFVDLLDAVSLVNPEMRIRFTSPHPKDFPLSLLLLMKERQNICKTIHLPAQSGSTTCLERMRRGYSREAYIELVHKIKEVLPNVAFTSDFISGFCGETEQEHDDTINLLKLVKYNFCFMYPYSMREKTKAFYHLKDDVPQEVKSRRYTEMVNTFRTTAHDLNKTKIGQTHLVLIDTISKRSVDDLSGRNDHNNIVVFPKIELPNVNNEHKLEMPQVGDYVACKILSSTSQSLRAEPLYKCNIKSFDKMNFN